MLYGFAAQKGKWNDCGNLYYTQPDNEDTMDKVMHCLWSTCYTLETHLIGRCVRSIPALTLQGIERKESDYINIDEHITIEKIRDYFMYIDPIEVCKHCKGSDGEEIEAAIQL